MTGTLNRTISLFVPPYSETRLREGKCENWDGSTLGKKREEKLRHFEKPSNCHHVLFDRLPIFKATYKITGPLPSWHKLKHRNWTNHRLSLSTRMLCIPGIKQNDMSQSTSYTFETSNQRVRFENQLLPLGFTPTDKDIICGRARENFHHGTQIDIVLNLSRCLLASCCCCPRRIPFQYSTFTHQPNPPRTKRRWQPVFPRLDST